MPHLDVRQQPIRIGDDVLLRYSLDLSQGVVTDIKFDSPDSIEVSTGRYRTWRVPDSLLVINKQLEYFHNEYPELQL